MKRKGAILSVVAIILVFACMLAIPVPAVSLAAYDSGAADEESIVWGDPVYEEYFNTEPNASKWVVDNYTYTLGITEFSLSSYETWSSGRPA